MKFNEKEEYPALHDFEVFRETYCPACRLLANKYVPFLPLFAEIDKKLESDRLIIAVDGGSGSGKTTLSEELEKIYDCTVFHMDDYFLQPHQRTEERYAQTGGNVDWERFLEEVLLPLRREQTVNYRRFDCHTMELQEAVRVVPKKLVIIEGAYSLHPNLAKYYDLSVFLDISPDLQKKRILKRNTPEMAARFFEKWIPLEKKYFNATGIVERCDLRIEIRE